MGEASLHDLGGNVAEYSGSGKVYGYSAYDLADPSATLAAPGGQWAGFRVVKE
jgi:hypothetical protein